MKIHPSPSLISLVIGICLCILFTNNALSQQKYSPSMVQDKLVVMIPTGQTSQNLPVFKILPATDPDYKAANTILTGTYMGYSVLLYDYIQQYLLNKNVISIKEPAYLALTHNEGCFGLIGFYIDQDGKLIDKSKSGYIDLNKRSVSEPFDRLESITQLFPHEMGHVMMMLLFGKTEEGNLPGTTNIHYFSIVTDYRTAFSEGFAEHMENISRDNEKNATVKKGIESDAANSLKIFDRFAVFFKKDYTWPLRMGFYRAITPLRYQQFENYKRYIWAEKFYSKFKTTVSGREGSDKYLLYRNTGVSFDTTKLRNVAQCESNEGVIASFFYGLLNSDCINTYKDNSFYSLFLPPESMEDPKTIIDPLTNEYLKIFYIFNNYLQTNYFGSSLMHQFMKAYLTEFPEERTIILNVYKTATGHTYEEKEIPELWLMAKNFKHSFWVMAQFGLKSPYYTFNLNAADAADLMTLKGISKEDAKKIIQYRDSIGAFNSVNEIAKINGISGSVADIIIASEIKEMPDLDFPEMSFQKLLVYPLLNLGINLMIWFLIFMVLFFFFYYRTHKRNIAIWKFIIAKFIDFLVLTLCSLIICVFFSRPLIYVLAFAVFVLLLKLIINRKNAPRRKEVLISYLTMTLIMIYSLI